MCCCRSKQKTSDSGGTKKVSETEKKSQTDIKVSDSMTEMLIKGLQEALEQKKEEEQKQKEERKGTSTSTSEKPGREEVKKKTASWDRPAVPKMIETKPLFQVEPRDHLPIREPKKTSAESVTPVFRSKTSLEKLKQKKSRRINMSPSVKAVQSSKSKLRMQSAAPLSRKTKSNVTPVSTAQTRSRSKMVSPAIAPLMSEGPKPSRSEVVTPKPTPKTSSKLIFARQPPPPPPPRPNEPSSQASPQYSPSQRSEFNTHELPPQDILFAPVPKDQNVEETSIFNKKYAQGPNQGDEKVSLAGSRYANAIMDQTGGGTSFSVLQEQQTYRPQPSQYETQNSRYAENIAQETGVDTSYSRYFEQPQRQQPKPSLKRTKSQTPSESGSVYADTLAKQYGGAQSYSKYHSKHE